MEAAYTRARLLCQQLGDTQDVFPVLFGLWRFYVFRADYPTVRQLGEDLLSLAEQKDDASHYVIAHCASKGVMLTHRNLISKEEGDRFIFW